MNLIKLRQCGQLYKRIIDNLNKRVLEVNKVILVKGKMIPQMSFTCRNNTGNSQDNWNDLVPLAKGIKIRVLENGGRSSFALLGRRREIGSRWNHLPFTYYFVVQYSFSSNYLLYVCITDCLGYLLRFITVIYFVRFIIYSCILFFFCFFFTHSPYILFFLPALYLLVGHLVFSIWLLF